MNQPTAKLLILTGPQFACLKIQGRANFASSIDFKSVLNELQGRGFTYFVLDLSDCILMDSTFLGVLAGFGLKMRQMQGGLNSSPIELYNPNTRITELLDSLGVIHLFQVTSGALKLDNATEAEHPAPVNATKAEMTQAALDAHRTLMEINPGNAAKFKEVAQFLAEDLKRLKPGH